MEFTTRRCEIKKFIPEYISILYDLIGKDRDVGMYLLDYKENMSIDDFKAFLFGKNYNENILDISIIKDKQTNDVLGYVSLFKEDSRSKSINIVLGKDYWNRGYGKEVVKKIAEMEKANGLGSLYAACNENDERIQKVLENADFELIDNMPGERKDLNGKIGDEFLYELEMIRVKYDT
ncbi:MAG: GNAT family N-acetyltransferase [Bacilli bacterium]|nr:GNAT family N-acetyltransferase [Bacilli bacterium]